MREVLVLAGFDPSGGAGVLQDVATLNSLGLGAKSVISCNTGQDHTHCFWVESIPEKQVLSQLDILLAKYSFSAVKVGAFPNLELLHRCLEKVESHCGHIPVVWDPVLKASSGAEFNSQLNTEILGRILGQVFLLTPNLEEYQQFCENLGKSGLKVVNCLITSYQNTDQQIVDKLIIKSGEEFEFVKEKEPGKDLHGSGCRFSALVAGHMAKGDELSQAIESAKHRITELYKTLDY